MFSWSHPESPTKGKAKELKCDIPLNLLQRQGIKFICYWKARLAHISASNPSQFVQEMTQGIYVCVKIHPKFLSPKDLQNEEGSH